MTERVMNECLSWNKFLELYGNGFPVSVRPLLKDTSSVQGVFGKNSLHIKCGSDMVKGILSRPATVRQFENTAHDYTGEFVRVTLTVGLSHDEISGVFYSTNDYSKFRKLLGNRDVTEQRINAITDSIRKHGYIKNPIVVNEKFEIIDGQGRFSALQRMGLPIDYILVPNLGIEDCIAMNIKMRNWNTRDYIDSYANRGNEDYIVLRDLLEEFPSIEASATSGMAMGNLTTGNAIIKVQEGNFSIQNTDIDLLRQTLSFIVRVQKQTGDIKGKNKYFALAFCYRFPNCDTKHLEKVVIENHRNIAIPSKTVDVAREIQIAYNRRRTESNRIYFEVEYEKACRASNGLYKYKIQSET